MERLCESSSQMARRPRSRRKRRCGGAWAAALCHDFFCNICSNHEHDCTETCVKYVKKKLEAKESLRSNRTPSCRFLFFRIKQLRLGARIKRVRRRGKPLVRTPFIDFSDDRNQRCRCQVKRDQPFRSSSNDVSQVTSRAKQRVCLLLITGCSKEAITVHNVTRIDESAVAEAEYFMKKMRTLGMRAELQQCGDRKRMDE